MRFNNTPQQQGLYLHQAYSTHSEALTQLESHKYHKAYRTCLQVCIAHGIIDDQPALELATVVAWLDKFRENLSKYILEVEWSHILYAMASIGPWLFCFPYLIPGGKISHTNSPFKTAVFKNSTDCHDIVCYPEDHKISSPSGRWKTCCTSPQLILIKHELQERMNVNEPLQVWIHIYMMLWNANVGVLSIILKEGRSWYCCLTVWSIAWLHLLHKEIWSHFSGTLYICKLREL